MISVQKRSKEYQYRFEVVKPRNDVQTINLVENDKRVFKKWLTKTFVINIMLITSE